MRQAILQIENVGRRLAKHDVLSDLSLSALNQPVAGHVLEEATAVALSLLRGASVPSGSELARVPAAPDCKRDSQRAQDDPRRLGDVGVGRRERSDGKETAVEVESAGG